MFNSLQNLYFSRTVCNTPTICQVVEVVELSNITQDDTIRMSGVWATVAMLSDDFKIKYTRLLPLKWLAMSDFFTTKESVLVEVQATRIEMENK